MKAISFTIILIVFLLPLQILSQTEWKLEKDKHGIQVYVRHVPWSDYNQTRGITEINAPLHQCVGVLQDGTIITDWVHSAKDAEVLNTKGDSVMIYWMESGAPWPFKNRDAVYKNVFTWDPGDNSVKNTVTAIPGYIPEKDGLVRIRKAKSIWELTSLGQNRTKLQLTMHFEPHGSIPAWLANAFAVNSPYESMIGLIEMSRTKDYSGEKFGFMSMQ